MFNFVQIQGFFMNFSSLITTCQPYLHSLHVSKRNLVPRIPACVDWIKKSPNLEFLEAEEYCQRAPNLSAGQMDCNG